MGNSRDQGVNFPLVGKYCPDDDRDCIDSQYAGAGYTTKQGVVHFNVGDDAPPIKNMTEEQSDAHIVGVIFSQNFSLKKGLELFGEKADAAVHKELSQIHKMDTYEPLHKSDLSFEDRKKALALLMFITEKRNGDIKARKVADGSKQRTYDGYDRSDGSLTTVATDGILMIGVIDVKEMRAIAILDIANAFLHAENGEKILMLYAVD